jgi:hypothetical protein
MEWWSNGKRESWKDERVEKWKNGKMERRTIEIFKHFRIDTLNH